VNTRYDQEDRYTDALQHRYGSHICSSMSSHHKEAMMATTAISTQQPAARTTRPFSLTTYLLIVVALSWPFQIAYVVWDHTPWMRYTLSSLSMVMVAVATLIASRYVFRDSLAKAGWRWGTPIHYVVVLGVALLVWAVPTVLELFFGLRSRPTNVVVSTILAVFAVRFIATLLPAWGEEFGWRGYLLPHLAHRYRVRTALLIHAFIWWAWHLPALVGIALHTDGVLGGGGVTIAVVLLVSLILAMMHAIIFAYIWTTTHSLAVAAVYHAAFDEVRDAIEASIGFGPLVDPWQMIVLTVIGTTLLWKGNWQRLRSDHAAAA
jgi:membrane protease YdiL (CAAX protease family)